MGIPKDIYQSRKAQGICTRCGKRKSARGHKGDMTTTCKPCNEGHLLRNKLYREKKFPARKIKHEEREKRSLEIQKEVDKM